MRHVPQSPYTRALGERRWELHPRLREYFAPIPEGMVGRGEGIFAQVGTPRRWLWPFLRVLQHRGVVVAGWDTQVPFRVTNRTVAGRMIADREFLFPRGAWTMRDAVALSMHGRLVDEAGEPATVAVSFDIEVRAEKLMLRSHAVGLRLGRMRIRVPRFISPRLTLTESYDAEQDKQHVAVEIRMPVIGRVYEYAGSFVYRIEEDS